MGVSIQWSVRLRRSNSPRYGMAPFRLRTVTVLSRITTSPSILGTGNPISSLVGSNLMLHDRDRELSFRSVRDSVLRLQTWNRTNLVTSHLLGGSENDCSAT